MGVKVIQKNPKWIGPFIKTLQAKSDNEIAVGFPSGKCQAYPDGTEVASVAAQHVYGMGVPQRDFIAYAQGDIQKRTAPVIQLIVTETHEGAVRALSEAAGQEAAEAIKSSIINGPWEPNSPKTIEAKGSSKPLIDTSHMVNSVTYVIRRKTQ